MPPQQRLGDHWYLGTADAVFQNIYTLQQERPARVLILAGDHLYKLNYEKMIRFHQRKGADATVACVCAPIEEGERFGILSVDEDRRITHFEEKPTRPQPMPGRPHQCLASMGIYVFDTETLVHVVSEDARNDTKHDFGNDILPRMVDTHAVYAACFDEMSPGDCYWRDIGTIDAYWQANMDLLGPQPEFTLFDDAWPIRSYHTQRPPFRSCGDADVRDSFVSGGAAIDRARVERSVLGPGVRLAPGSEVMESVLFDDVRIGRNVKVRRAIIDKNNRLPARASLGMAAEEDRRRFTITDGGIVVVPKEVPGTEEFWLGD
jgi:glucose-1-phosphate adenylyltransferase